MRIDMRFERPDVDDIWVRYNEKQKTKENN